MACKQRREADKMRCSCCCWLLPVCYQMSKHLDVCSSVARLQQQRRWAHEQTKPTANKRRETSPTDWWLRCVAPFDVRSYLHRLRWKFWIAYRRCSRRLQCVNLNTLKLMLFPVFKISAGKWIATVFVNFTEFNIFRSDWYRNIRLRCMIECVIIS